MAAATSLLARNQKQIARTDSTLRDNHIELTMPLLPDKKEWLADHDIEMLMLDGYESNSFQLKWFSQDWG